MGLQEWENDLSVVVSIAVGGLQRVDCASRDLLTRVSPPLPLIPLRGGGQKNSRWSDVFSYLRKKLTHWSPHVREPYTLSELRHRPRFPARDLDLPALDLLASLTLLEPDLQPGTEPPFLFFVDSSAAFLFIFVGLSLFDWFRTLDTDSATWDSHLFFLRLVRELVPFSLELSAVPTPVFLSPT